jgi:hypothetical protein
MSSTYKNIPKQDASDGISDVVSESSAITISHNGQVVGIGLDTSGIVAESAASVVNTYTAGESISALKAVYELSGVIYKAAPDTIQTASVVGITLTSANAGEQVQVLQYGVLQDAFLTFSPADLIFVTSNGAITNVAPASGYLTRLGRAINVNTVLIIIDSPKTL